jgi:hypothetical protein
LIVLAAAVAFGAVDQYAGAQRSSFLTAVSGMSAPWLLVPFLAGMVQAGPRRAALTGLAATWLAVLAYVVMIISPVEGTHLGPRPAGVHGTWSQLSPHLFAVTLASQWLWFAGGLITGPLYGWLGFRLRARRSWAAALVAVLPVLLEPAARWLGGHLRQAAAGGPSLPWLGSGPVASAEVTEVAVGLVLTALAVTAMLRARATRHT